MSPAYVGDQQASGQFRGVREEVFLQSRIYPRSGQNIVDQPPFERMATEIYLPNGFFVGPDSLAGLGAFVRCVVFEPHHWANTWNLPPLTHLAPHVNPAYHKKTSLETYHLDALRFIDSFEYLMQYLREYWQTAGRLYDTEGYPVKPHTSTKIYIPRFTFAAYQAQKRGDPFFGLRDELPGLETAESFRASVGQGKRPANRMFRVYQTLKE